MSKRKKYTVELNRHEATAAIQALLSAELLLRNRADEQRLANDAIRDLDWADVHRKARISIESAITKGNK